MKKKHSSISSPEELNKHLQKSSPMTWLVLFLVTGVLLAFFVWSFIFKMKIKLSGKATINSGAVTLVIADNDLNKLAVGQTVTISNKEGKILSFDEDKKPVISNFELDDGEYTYQILIEEKRPVDFLIGK